VTEHGHPGAATGADLRIYESIAANYQKGSAARCPDCTDRDADCDDIPDKVACWLYDPARGMCLFLRK
jgi:hypothetical protein